MRVYGGILALRPTELSFSGRAPQTTAERLELSRTQAAVLAARLRGKEIRTEHGGVRVGTVTEAGFDREGNLCVRFALDDTPVGQGNGRLIDGGFLRGLSLSHHAETLEPEEVSLCFEGARPGTFITETPASAARSELAPLQCIPSDSPPLTTQGSHFIRASVVSLARAPMAQQQQLLEHAQMVPPHMVGLPAAGQAAASPHTTVHNPLNPGPQQSQAQAQGQAQGQQQQQQGQQQRGRRQFARAADGSLVEITALVSEEEAAATGSGQTPVQASGGGQMPPALAAYHAQKAAASEGPASGAGSADASGAASEAPKMTRAELLEAISKQDGKLTQEQIVQLAQTFIRHKGDQEAFAERLRARERENEELKQQLATTDDGAKRSRQILFDNIMSAASTLVKTYMGDDSLTPQMEKEMAAQRDQPHSLERLAEMIGPSLVMASRAATQERRRPPVPTLPVDQRLRQTLDLLAAQEAGQATQRLPSAALGWGRVPAPAAAAAHTDDMVQASRQQHALPSKRARSDEDFSAFDQLRQEAGRVTALSNDSAGAYARASQIPEQSPVGLLGLPRRG